LKITFSKKTLQNETVAKIARNLPQQYAVPAEPEGAAFMPDGIGFLYKIEEPHMMKEYKVEGPHMMLLKVSESQWDNSMPNAGRMMIKLSDIAKEDGEYSMQYKFDN